MSGSLLIVVLALLGGLIAIAGDRIGLKTGRKRLTVFGLRPKYTSIIITFLTGVAVVALTVTVLSLLSENVRIAIFQINELRRDLTLTNETLETTKSELTAKRDEAEQLTKMVADVGRQYEALKSDYNVISGELENAISEKAQTIRDLNKLQAGLEQVEAKLQETERDLNAASIMIVDADSRISNQEGEIAELSTEREALQGEIVQLEETRRNLIEEAAELEKQVNSLMQTSLLLIQSKQTSMTRQVIFYADQIIIGEVIDCSQPVEAIHTQINDFLIKVNSLAKAKGAGEVPDRQDGSVLNFDEENVLNAFQKIYASAGKVILRALSPVNSWPGEPLWVSLHAFPDELIFFTGQVIAGRTVDGSSGADRIQMEILNLIEEVNSIAIAKGMVSDQEGRIGTFIKALEFTEAIIGSLEAGKPVRIEIAAEEDIWRSDNTPTMSLRVVY